MSRWRRSPYERPASWGWFPSTRRREVVGGLKLRAGRGEIAATWWGKRWIEVLDSFGWHTRLQRGRHYARAGQVASIDILPGVVKAKVQGSRSKPYDVEIRLHAFSKKDWSRAAEAVSRKALYAAKLLVGEMPQEIEAAFKSAKLALFPSTRKDLVTECSCPDWENPCKHIAAAHYILAQEFDRDPFLIFKMRGIGKDELLAELRARRSAPAPKHPDEPCPPAGPSGPRAEKPLRAKTAANRRGADLSALKDIFYKLAKDLPAIQAPAPAALENLAPPGAKLRELGVPPFWRGEADILKTLESRYAALRRRVAGIAVDPRAR